MQHLKFRGAVRPLKWSLGVKWIIQNIAVGTTVIIFDWKGSYVNLIFMFGNMYICM